MLERKEIVGNQRVRAWWCAAHQDRDYLLQPPPCKFNDPISTGHNGPGCMNHCSWYEVISSTGHTISGWKSVYVNRTM